MSRMRIESDEECRSILDLVAHSLGDGDADRFLKFCQANFEHRGTLVEGNFRPGGNGASTVVQALSRSGGAAPFCYFVFSLDLADAGSAICDQDSLRELIADPDACPEAFIVADLPPTTVVMCVEERLFVRLGRPAGTMPQWAIQLCAQLGTQRGGPG